jgi:hypothetical protein
MKMKRRHCQVALCGAWGHHPGICATHQLLLPTGLLGELVLAYHACPERHFTALYRGTLLLCLDALRLRERDEVLDELTLQACEGDAVARLAMRDRMLELGLVVDQH